MKIEYEPIGVVRSPFSKRAGMPIQPSRGKGVQATIELRPKLVAGLADLEGFSHIVLLYHFHHSSGYDLRVIPFLDTEKRGVFATRAPRRPNPIGLSVVRLLRIEGSILYIEDVDLLDGTPVLDIKPYVPDFDEPVDVRIGWLAAVHRRPAESDDRFG
ncbi:MAG: tRNA (N6-threonylcarbamoyladenosine(37)-N6)-methyltransferase TrmO [Acidobacteria bacterium]|nr:tRNA (N6-threonylcarbamoyladenosine(37)-N6)-methyltransferase TrmO [Acidobacteriota bacterium]